METKTTASGSDSRVSRSAMRNAVLNCIKRNYRLSAEDEVNLVRLSGMEDMACRYIRLFGLYEPAQLAMFEQQKASELVSACIAKCSLSVKAEIKLFFLPDAEHLVWKYIRRYALNRKAEKMLIYLPHAEDIIKFYISKYPLCDEVLLKIADQHYAEPVLNFYFQLHKPSKKLSAKLRNFWPI
ncbi:MAG: hypothetical protein IJ852_02005 [Alphaproteobacteria bacterium]|nr:hypothetical protein [Alphaproteobacteria bacterium]